MSQLNLNLGRKLKQAGISQSERHANEGEWFPVPDYPKYIINRLGVVKRLGYKTCEGSQKRSGRKKFIDERIMSPRPRAGYLSVNLRGGTNGNKGVVIHRILAKLFVPNPENKHYVNHINGIKTDNRIENLEWCTMQENTIHAYAMGLTPSGSKARHAKLSEADVMEVFRLHSQGIPGSRIAKKYSLHKNTIYHIVNGKNWKHFKEKRSLVNT